MEVLTETNSTFSHRRKLKVIQYDSPAFRDLSGSETKVRRTLREQFIQCPRFSNIPLPKNDINVSYTANEMVNACYAKIWRGSSAKLNICGEEPGIEEDSEMYKAFPIYLGKDLDKLQKLRLKTRFKSQKSLDNDEVKAWIEAPEKFIDILTELQQEKNKENIEGGSKEIIEPSDEMSETSAANVQSKRSSHAVHFPQHVLLCAALQEGDSEEMDKVIKDNSIDLNSLTQATGYYYLHKTILNDQLQCARMLIQNGIDVNAKDSEGVSPLALAFRLMNFPVVALLVQSGADVGEYTNSRIQEMNQVKELSCSVSKVFEMDV